MNNHSDPADTARTAKPIATAAAAVSSLHGRSVVIIGGGIRSHALRKLKVALQLADAIWIPTRASDPTSRAFRGVIARADVDIVVILCGLLRHHHVAAARALCKQHGKEALTLWRSISQAAILRAVGRRGAVNGRVTLRVGGKSSSEAPQ